jgi:hypothetical protein
MGHEYKRGARGWNWERERGKRRNWAVKRFKVYYIICMEIALRSPPDTV